MKNLKLLLLFTIVSMSLLSFTCINQNDLIKDGTYKAFFSKKASIQGFGHDTYEQGVTVKIENNLVMEISPLNFNRSSDKLLRLPLEIDKNGDAIVETFAFEQNINNRNDKGSNYTYKLKINKEELKK